MALVIFTAVAYIGLGILNREETLSVADYIDWSQSFSCRYRGGERLYF